MLRFRDLRRVARNALGAAWRTRMLKFSLLLLAIAAASRSWIPLIPPAVYYGIRLLRLVVRRILYPVRAKLAAFYLYAALLPVLLVASVLLVVGFLALGHVSAQVVERRLQSLANWAEQRARVAETVYWQVRSAGETPRAAARRALDAAYADATTSGLACWVLDETGNVVASLGDVEAHETRVPRWLGGQRFAGIAVREGRLLEMRSRVRLQDPLGVLELGSAHLVGTRLLNAGLPGLEGSLHGGVGERERLLTWSVSRSESLAAREGILASYEVDGVRKRSATQPGAADAHDVVETDYQRIIRLIGAASGFPALLWAYSGHPVDWSNGLTSDSGPEIMIAFSIEGAIRALLRTSFGAAEIFWVGALVVIGLIVLLQFIATVRGLLYARSISSSVAKLDRGVRAVRQGDFGYRIQPRERDQLGALAVAFNDMSQRLRTLLEERATHEAVERELSIAREVQERLFPDYVPSAPFLEASGVCFPARSVSGDYYDFLEVEGGYDAVIADVSGKGVSAALLMASVHAALRSQYVANGGSPPDPAEVLARVNRILHGHIEPTRFVTLFLVRYLGDGRIVYCNAGHNPAALVREGRVEWLRAGGLMLGPFPDQVYEAVAVQVQPGDLVCLYTDGITEAVGPMGEQFGEERLAELLCSNCKLAPKQLQETIIERIRDWQGEGEAGDDVTLVLLRVKQRPDAALEV